MSDPPGGIEISTKPFEYVKKYQYDDLLNLKRDEARGYLIQLGALNQYYLQLFINPEYVITNYGIYLKTLKCGFSKHLQMRQFVLASEYIDLLLKILPTKNCAMINDLAYDYIVDSLKNTQYCCLGDLTQFPITFKRI